MSKQYVAVDARHDPVAGVMPLCIYWKDGRRFEVDRILDVRRAASLKAGGAGLRFTVRILNKERYLFLEEGRWFVEEKD